MSIKAQWYADTVADQPETTSPAAAEDTFRQLFDELTDLTRREGELFNCGITCPIRDVHGSVCSVCPLSHHADRLDPLQPLCTVGRQTERVLTRMAIAKGSA